MQISQIPTVVQTRYRPLVSLKVSVRGSRGRVASLTRASSLNNSSDNDSSPQENESWTHSMGALAQRIERLRRTGTACFLQHGYQASVLEARAQELLDSRPDLPDPSVAAPSWEESLAQQQQDHGRIIGSWHEDAWQQMRRAVHPDEASEDTGL